ncbi:substrate-binding domain-containing protein [Succinivibrio dextrinosolvens]|uniref:substrate-binding domain-containing protein n=1 Tax=Succinivibrio dextrinosolvens TaxID=83771 RepID=UPI00247B2C79|nr:substrate-binding domain-containing protein [Succinivibrio dextrinosolvens]
MMKIKTLLSALAVGFTICSTAAISEASADELTFAGVGKVNTPWFVRHKQGVMLGAEENNVKGVYKASTIASQKKQAEIVEDFIKDGVNALLVVPNDAQSLEKAFMTAQKQGITVITHESPKQVNADFDVELIENEKFGILLMDEFVKLSKGKKGSYAIYVGSLTVPAHNLWAKAAIQHQKEKYPQLELIEIFPISENRGVSGKTALSLIKKHPDLVGIITLGSEGAPGIGKALMQNKLKDKITVIGVATPNDTKEYVKDDYVQELILWDPAQAARVQTILAKMIADGRRDEIKPGFTLPEFGAPRFDGNTLIFDDPLIVTKDNVDNYDF